MAAQDKKTITVEAIIHSPVEKVWKFWTDPGHITRWNNASDDWHTPQAENDLQAGGRFVYTMAARDGSQSFDFSGTYRKVEENNRIEYTLDDGRKAVVVFQPDGRQTRVTETFEPESTHSIELQQNGWQAILDNFKQYVESFAKLETLRFDISIDASPEKVYKMMLDANKYPEWTIAFNPNSRFIGNWKTGSKMTFLGDDENGETAGMLSRVKENIPGKYLFIEHIGVLQGGLENTGGPDIDTWYGAREIYTFENRGNHTLLKIEMETTGEFKSFFEKTWPEALQKLKEMCEA